MWMYSIATGIAILKCTLVPCEHCKFSYPCLVPDDIFYWTPYDPRNALFSKILQEEHAYKSKESFPFAHILHALVPCVIPIYFEPSSQPIKSIRNKVIVVIVELKRSVDIICNMHIIIGWLNCLKWSKINWFVFMLKLLFAERPITRVMHHQTMNNFDQKFKKG